MLTIITPKRPPDGYGAGEFGARRGERTHQGVDFACYPGSQLMSLVSGRVSKLGYPYADDLAYRYIEITDADLNRHRFFYVDPSVDIGELVHTGEPIGHAQDITARYTKKPMNNHIHYEIIDSSGHYRNPELMT